MFYFNICVCVEFHSFAVLFIEMPFEYEETVEMIFVFHFVPIWCKAKRSEKKWLKIFISDKHKWLNAKICLLLKMHAKFYEINSFRNCNFLCENQQGFCLPHFSRLAVSFKILKWIQWTWSCIYLSSMLS